MPPSPGGEERGWSLKHLSRGGLWGPTSGRQAQTAASPSSIPNRLSAKFRAPSSPRYSSCCSIKPNLLHSFRVADCLTEHPAYDKPAAMFLSLIYQDREASSFRSQDAPLGPVSKSSADQFLETSAHCSFCLDLKGDHLRQQWRKFGQMVPVNAPYGFTLERMEENLALTGCSGCTVIQRAAWEIKMEYGLPFRHATLEFLKDEKREGLSLKLSMLHPAHTSWEDWQLAQANPDLKIEMATGPSELSPEREWEHRIVSPRFELFSPGTPDGPPREPPEKNFSAERDQGHWDGIKSRIPRVGNTASDPSVKWTMAALSHCRSNHAECNVGDANPLLPTRVLDLGDSGTTSEAGVKLYVTNGERGEYLCLSHCWGVDKKPIETRRATMRQFQSGISWDDLPKSFQDAVAFTRKLGHRFLWIDSLCIVQDDPADWAREAGRMASIYENALLTLAAASSTNSQGGLFRASKPSRCLTRSDDGIGQPVVHMRRFVNPKFFDHRRSGEDDTETSPLLKRAWVFQERILSRRVLFFTPLELVLECRVANCSESGHSWAGSETKHEFRTVYDDGAVTRSQLSRLWRQLVREFTHLQLTLVKDTIPAMAGIAKRIQQSRDMNLRYAAGLWEDRFLEDMLWEVPPFSSSGDEHRINHALPSWSWARSDAPKRYFQSEQLTHLCTVEGVRCAPGAAADDALVNIQPGAHVIVSGFLLPAKSTKYGVVIDGNPRIFHIPRRDYSWGTGEDGEGIIRDGDDIYILPLVVSESRTNDSGQDAGIHALVLRQSPDDPTTYTRAAIFWTSVHHLLHHEYMFQGTDALLSVLQAQVAYGESVLGEDGVYHRPQAESSEAGGDDATSSALVPGGPTATFNAFTSAVQHRHLLLYGKTNPELPMDEFYGLVHLEMLRAEMLAEEARASEWRRREEHGETQAHERVRIKIA